MNDIKNSTDQQKETPSCNVNQAFNFTVGAIAILLVVISYYLFY